MNTVKQLQSKYRCYNVDCMEFLVGTNNQSVDLVFAGTGTTLAVAKRLNRKWAGCDQSAKYVKGTIERLRKVKVSEQ